jgi:hypothetical protein
MLDKMFYSSSRERSITPPTIGVTFLVEKLMSSNS